ncbi:MAG: hypothetical protein IH624_14685 [Phycisphaerae bacterium]|nr:hypothetical protein [Phycisphaerae bacterium]
MKAQIFLAAVLLATLSTVGTSQKNDPIAESLRRAANTEDERIARLPYDVRSLVGVQGIFVLVEYLDEDSKAVGLTEDQLKTDIELKLRLAGIKVNSSEDRRFSDDSFTIYVNITSIRRDLLLVYSASVQLRQDVYLARKPNRYCERATTWQKSCIGTVGESKATTVIRDAVKDRTDMFVNDYLTANPKK